MPHMRGVNRNKKIHAIEILEDPEFAHILGIRGGHAGVPALKFGLKTRVETKLESRRWKKLYDTLKLCQGERRLDLS